MYHFNEIGREHHRDLLREAENARLARRLREARPQKYSRPGSRMVKLRGATVLWGGTHVPFFRA